MKNFIVAMTVLTLVACSESSSELDLDELYIWGYCGGYMDGKYKGEYSPQEIDEVVETIKKDGYDSKMCATHEAVYEGRRKVHDY